MNRENFILIIFALSFCAREIPVEAQEKEPVRTMTEYEWDNGRWSDKLKEEYEYDSVGCLRQTLRLYHDGGKWLNNQKIIYSDNNAGYRTSTIIYDWDESRWIESQAEKTQYIYDSLPLYIYSLKWNSGLWDTVSCWSYRYNSKQKKTEELFQTYYDSVWFNISHGLFEYDSSGFHNLFITQRWNAGEWENFRRFEYYSDSLGRRRGSLWCKWNNLHWVPEEKRHYSLNSKGKADSVLKTVYEDTEWVNHTKWQYLYNKVWDLAEESILEWKDGKWQYVSRKEYDYGPNFNLTEEILSIRNNNQWQPSRKRIYDYTVGIEEFADAGPGQILATPNPFCESFRIKFVMPEPGLLTIEMHTITGMCTGISIEKYFAKGSFEELIEASGLSGGIYMLTLSGKSKQERALLIKY